MSEAIQRLQHLMTCLRDKEFGCAWDKQQTYQTIAPYTLEEAYEVIDAIERSDYDDLKDELGDLLFQVIFYSQIALEDDKFNFDDVVNGIVAKMLRRHPHIFPQGELSRFGEPNTLSEAEISVQWQAIKAQEKASKPKQSVLDDVPSSMPSMMQAVKLQQKASKFGFDWPDVMPVFAKIREELDELEEAIKAGEQEHIAEEMGDVLFAMTNLARHLDVSPDMALNKTNIKFRRRFARIETLLVAQNRKLTNCSLEELDRYWEQAKSEGL
ncbi:nucleoside triphosphate pyrophosphohydrolase [Marinomonas posidonica]|uniref:Nucleoside triphosphate pyrophosphohydrolase n=1 Tax=Marinomonas posidonica (strain CECT 7376 / NCIMB 14433 / IVIA-Po-181) TaxID=491952 RepID=F6CY48_MARPP|nr:nucleoside triphosphate pyrophosphohydrolase [Marinomonas posidonica]AEF55680.1 MazG family protein [Marinomonas posidonica IVIA-Po-181]